MVGLDIRTRPQTETTVHGRKTEGFAQEVELYSASSKDKSMHSSEDEILVRHLLHPVERPPFSDMLCYCKMSQRRVHRRLSSQTGTPAAHLNKARKL